MDRSLASYILRRSLQIPPLMLGISILTFLIFYLSPVNPVVAYLGLVAVQKMPPEDVARVEEQLGLNQAAHVRYLAWLERILHGDWRFSHIKKRPVLDIILERFPATLLLTLTGYGLSAALAILLGLYSALRAGSRFDAILNSLNYMLYSTPTFLVALLAVLVFSVWLDWFPSSRMVSVNEPTAFLPNLADRIYHLMLPASILAISHLAVFSSYIRSSLQESLQEDYILTARSKGLDEMKIVLRHAFRNSLLPFITQVGLSIPLLIGGSVIVESIFAWPGIGKLTYDAALRADYMLLMGLTLFSSSIVILGNLMADVGCAMVDPRIKYR
ncbi:MAG: nickel transporter permease NikB [Methanosaeta sp. PtaU1.Bin060]|nr:MAG: nickel transporter permease NikB [Methanosaeta sp. PtaU1.Bin060]